MIGYVSGVRRRESWRDKAVDISTILFLAKKEEWKFESVCLGARVKDNTDRRIYIKVNVLERNSPSIESVDTFVNGKFRGELKRRPVSRAGSFKRVYGEIAADFFDGCPIPVSELAIFIEECDGAPLAFVAGELGTADRRCALECALEICVSEPAKNGPELVEEFSAVGRVILGGSRDCAFPLCAPIGWRERQSENNGNRYRGVNHFVGHESLDNTLFEAGSRISRAFGDGVALTASTVDARLKNFKGVRDAAEDVPAE
jgi:hypothetical protein